MILSVSEDLNLHVSTKKLFKIALNTMSYYFIQKVFLNVSLLWNLNENLEETDCSQRK